MNVYNNQFYQWPNYFDGDKFEVSSEGPNSQKPINVPQDLYQQATLEIVSIMKNDLPKTKPIAVISKPIPSIKDSTLLSATFKCQEVNRFKKNIFKTSTFKNLYSKNIRFN